MKWGNNHIKDKYELKKYWDNISGSNVLIDVLTKLVVDMDEFAEGKNEKEEADVRISNCK